MLSLYFHLGLSILNAHLGLLPSPTVEASLFDTLIAGVSAAAPNGLWWKNELLPIGSGTFHRDLGGRLIGRKVLPLLWLGHQGERDS